MTATAVPKFARSKESSAAKRRSFWACIGMQSAGDRASGELITMERSRDLIAGQITLDYFMRKAAQGWKLTAVEWVRGAEDAATDSHPMEVSVEPPEEIPFGLRISQDGLHLEENPLELTVLMLILEKIVKEKRVTEIANELNTDGFRTRGGRAWTATAVFDLLPRLIEAGPKLLKSSEWQHRRVSGSAPN